MLSNDRIPTVFVLGTFIAGVPENKGPNCTRAIGSTQTVSTQGLCGLPLDTVGQLLRASVHRLIAALLCTTPPIQKATVLLSVCW